MRPVLKVPAPGPQGRHIQKEKPPGLEDQKGGGGQGYVDGDQKERDGQGTEKDEGEPHAEPNREGPEGGEGLPFHQKALRPVMVCPRMREWMSWVPSYV